MSGIRKLAIVLLAILFVISIAALFVGENKTCVSNSEKVELFSSSEETNDKSYNFDDYFIDLGSSYPYHFMCDRFTKVMYVEEMNRSYNLVALIKADGTPLTYDEWNQSVIKETR